MISSLYTLGGFQEIIRLGGRVLLSALMHPVSARVHQFNFFAQSLALECTDPETSATSVRTYDIDQLSAIDEISPPAHLSDPRLMRDILDLVALLCNKLDVLNPSLLANPSLLISDQYSLLVHVSS